MFISVRLLRPNMVLGNFVFVFVAGFVTALATGLGAIPFFFVDDVSDRWNVALWGLASGIMLSASVFGLVLEALGEYVTVSLNGVSTSPVPTRTYALLAVGLLAGVVLVVVAHRIIDGAEVNPKRYEEADFRKLLLILGVLTVHSFPEGVAVGVSFADLGLEGGLQLFGVAVPLLAVFMTVAISIHNVPEGVAISIPLRTMGVPNWKLVWWAVFSSLPQPIGAVIAFYFVRLAREFLPVGFGFAAGAMIYLVLTEFIPEALELGEGLPRGGRRELVAGITGGVLVMIPLAFL
jgi:ZIP family zinc transporter